MNKTFSLILAFLLFNIAFAMAVAPTVTPSTVEMSGSSGQTVTKTFNITNNQPGAVTFTFNTSAADLKDNDNDEINLSFTGGSGIASGATAAITASATIEATMDFDIFGGTITVSDGTETSNFQLNINVEPDICDLGVVGTDLKLEITDPDSGDDVKPGEDIEIKAEVENIGTDNIDVLVQAYLFNDNKKIESATSEVVNINDGDSETFRFSITVPLDSDDIGNGEDLKLFVKALDNDAEDENCIQTSTELSLNLDDNEVIFDRKESKFDPSTITCGQSTLAFLKFVNIGDDDQEGVYVTLTNSGLGYDEKSSSFDLSDFNSERSNSANAIFNVPIASDAPPGKYLFIARMHAQGKEDTIELPLNVLSCDGSDKIIENPSADLEVPKDTFKLEKGFPKLIPVKITNNENSPVTFFAELTNIEDFSNSVSSKQITLQPGRSATIFLPIEAREDAKPGKYSATVLLRTPTQNIGSETVMIEVPKTSGSQDLETSEYGSLTIWVVFIVMLVILIAVIAAALMRKK